MQIQSRCFVPRIYPQLPLTPVVLGEADEVVQRGVLGKLGFQDRVLRHHLDGVLDHLQNTEVLVETELLGIESTLEILVVVEVQVRLLK